MDIPKEAYPAVGAIFASLIGGAISFLSLVLSKESKISDFRQAWIDELRKDLALFNGLISNLYSNVEWRKRKDPQDINNYFKERHDDFAKINEVGARIYLRLNKDKHSKLIELLDKDDTDEGIQDLLVTDSRKKYLSELRHESREVLKTEWERVKRGERTFRITKWFSFAVFVSAILIGVTYATKSWWWRFVS